MSLFQTFTRRAALISVAAVALSTCTAFAGDLKMGFLLKTMQEERYKRDRAAFTAKSEELGAEVIFDSANNDEQTQLAKFENMLAKGASVIVLQPVNAGTAGSMVSMANSEGFRVVGYDLMLVDGPLDAMVMQDSWAVDRLLGEAMVEWLKAKNGDVTGKIALIQGQPGDSNAIAMSSGVLETLPHRNDPIRPAILANRAELFLTPTRQKEVTHTPFPYKSGRLYT